MKKDSHSLFIAVREKVAIVLCLIFVIVTGFAVLIYQTNRLDYKKGLLVNEFSRQKVLTVMMAKDSSRIYAMRLAMKTGANIQPEAFVVKRLEESKANLRDSRDEYTRLLDVLYQGKIYVDGIQVDFSSSNKKIEPYLKELTGIWGEFDRSVGLLIDQEVIDGVFNEALVFVNSNNERLLELSDSISHAVLNNMEANSAVSVLIVAVLIVSALAVIFISLKGLYYYVIIPLNELYRGLSETSLGGYEQLERSLTRSEIGPLVRDIGGSFDKLRKLISLIENINSNMSFNEVLNFIYMTFSTFIPYSYIGIALIKDAGSSLQAYYGLSDGTVKGLPQGLAGLTVDINETSLGKLLECGEARIINDLGEYAKGKTVKDYTRIIMEAGIKASITLPLKTGGKAVGIIFFSSTGRNVYNNEHVGFLKTLANSIAISFEKNIFVDHLLYSSILALAKLAEARDGETGDHLERMKQYSCSLAQLLSRDGKYSRSITLQFIEDLEKFSPMHDIGKVGIRDSILLKSEKLTGEEFEEMKRHAVYGANVLRAAEENMRKSGRSIFRPGIEIAESHHEKWDGSGYPRGLKGEEIPLSARIVAVADVFDALTSKRPYKEPYSFQASVVIIAQGGGKHFDPEIVRVFLKNKEHFKELCNKFQNREALLFTK